MDDNISVNNMLNVFFIQYLELIQISDFNIRNLSLKEKYNLVIFKNISTVMIEQHRQMLIKINK